MIDIRTVADQLTVARRERKAITPFTDEHPDFDFGSAYDAQDLFVEALEEDGQRVVGAKLGLTSRAKQQVMGVADPLYGWLTDTMVVEADNPVPVDVLIRPRAEPEIAFLLGRDLEGPATVTSVLAATEVVFAAMDILDSRYEDYRFKLPDVVADNCSSGGVVLGPQARRPDELEDLRLVGCVLRERGAVVATAAGAATMGHPANSVAWLVNRLAARGRGLVAGSLVLSGGLTAPVSLAHGGFVTAEFDGLGTVEAWA
ncbi:MAG: 2-keto-4-pentenoate hydratase [Acidimicrobiia bacterium]